MSFIKDKLVAMLLADQRITDFNDGVQAALTALEQLDQNIDLVIEIVSSPLATRALNTAQRAILVHLLSGGIVDWEGLAHLATVPEAVAKEVT